MDDSTPENVKWSDHELKMIRHREVFVHKPAIVKKAEHYLKMFEQAMVQELARGEIQVPTGTKVTQGQLVRGENHNGFPFLSLDIPQRFSKTEMFTYRTLFWWGHYLGFSLILKGNPLNEYLERLIASQKHETWSGVYLAAAPTPWEWSRSEENFKNVGQTSSTELRQTVQSIGYIKLCRFYPLEEESFFSLDWVSAGIQTWRVFSSITGS
ncbi:MAG: hypothetical protein ACE5E9_10535 [Nitrospinaceae bacterium]